jgi:GGDEF domain-containing protein
LTASVGMAIYPTDASEFGELIRQSDIAMYNDKARGPARPDIHVRQRTDPLQEDR